MLTTRLVMRLFITPFNLIPTEHVLTPLKVWTRLRTRTRSRASTKLVQIAAISVQGSYSCQMSIGMTPNPLFGRVALGLVQRLLQRLGRFRCSHRSVETKRESRLLISFQMLAVDIDLWRYFRSAFHHHEANREALCGRLIV